MNLLTPTQPAELPTEALLARLRCRRAGIDLLSGQETERAVSDAATWVYQRLNRRLRKDLTPFLDLLATRSLILALRYALAGEAPPAAVLRHSLLAKPIQNIIVDTEAAETTVARLEAVLSGDYPFVAGLTTTYRDQGPGGVEQQLADGVLQHGLGCSANKKLKEALSYLVDMRNCLMIHKLWRWQVSMAPPLTSGGRIAETSLRRIWAARDSDRLTTLVVRLAGGPVTSAKTIALEQSLLQGMTRRLRNAGRDPLGLGVIIEYLWLTQLAIHNQVLRQLLGADREELLEEVLLL
jgi:hypothetical protein